MADDSTGGADDSTEGAEKPAHVELAFQVAVSTIGQLEATWLWALKALEAIVPLASTTFPVLSLQLATDIQDAQKDLDKLIAEFENGGTKEPKKTHKKKDKSKKIK